MTRVLSLTRIVIAIALIAGLLVAAAVAADAAKYRSVSYESGHASAVAKQYDKYRGKRETKRSACLNTAAKSHAYQTARKGKWQNSVTSATAKKCKMGKVTAIRVRGKYSRTALLKKVRASATHKSSIKHSKRVLSGTGVYRDRKNKTQWSVLLVAERLPSKAPAPKPTTPSPTATTPPVATPSPTPTTPPPVVTPEPTAPAPTAASIASAPGTVTVGDAARFKVRIASERGVPTGAVSAYKDSTEVGTATLVNGEVTLNVANLPVGSHTLRFAYAGNDDHTASQVSSTVQVERAATATTVEAPSALTAGDIARVTVRVSSERGTPTGTITGRIGTEEVATAALTDGKADLAISDLPVGDHTLRLAFGANGEHAASEAEVTIVVEHRVARNTDFEQDIKSLILSGSESSDAELGNPSRAPYTWKGGDACTTEAVTSWAKAVGEDRSADKTFSPRAVYNMSGCASDDYPYGWVIKSDKQSPEAIVNDWFATPEFGKTDTGQFFKSGISALVAHGGEAGSLDIAVWTDHKGKNWTLMMGRTLAPGQHPRLTPEQVSVAEAKMLDLLDAWRAESNLPALFRDPCLDVFARDAGTWAGVWRRGGNGLGIFTTMGLEHRNTNAPCKAWNPREVLTQDSTHDFDPSPEYGKVIAARFMNNWKASQAHARALLDPGATDIGVSVYTGDNNIPYAVMEPSSGR